MGGAALVGGLAFKAFKNWQASKAQQPASGVDGQTLPKTAAAFENELQSDSGFQLTLVKAMIAAAKADGHIDEVEQTRIFDAVEEMPSSSDFKFMMMDLLRYPSSVQELASEVNSLEQKTELYLISCFAIDVDNDAESRYLGELANALGLPNSLALELQQQANHDQLTGLLNRYAFDTQLREILKDITAPKTSNSDELAVGAVYILQLTDAGVEAHFVSFDVSEDLTIKIEPRLLQARTPGVGVRVNFR